LTDGPGLMARVGRHKDLRAASGTTNLPIYRSLLRAYPDRDRRRMLLDLIETRGDKGKWFAAAKDSGFSTSLSGMLLRTQLTRATGTHSPWRSRPQRRTLDL
jgi:hypothetical protein